MIRGILRTVVPALCLCLGDAWAMSVNAAEPLKVKIGVITDMSGSLSDQSGRGSVVAAQMAVDDCMKAECEGLSVEVLSADHQNKADIAVNIVRKWIDVDGVNAVTDIIQASVQLAIQKLMAEKNRIALFPGGTARLANEDCAPSTSVVWMWDTYGQVLGIAKPLANAGSKWFFVTPDYAFGTSLQNDATNLVVKNGGKVVGGVRHPFNNQGDFASFLLQAQSSDADIIAIGSAGGDLVNVLKQAREFSVGGDSQKLASFVLNVSDINALGLSIAQGVTVAEAFYWNLDDGTRAWSRRFKERYGKGMPSTVQAGVYSVTRHYLKAVAAAKTTETAEVMKKMHEIAPSDPTIRNGKLRPDGRMIHDTYVFKVKSPKRSQEPYDFYDLVATIPAADAFRPLAESSCRAIVK